MNLKPLLLAPLLCLSACSSYEVLEAQQHAYDPATSARIRLYGNNGIPAAYWPGQDCKMQGQRIEAYGYDLAEKVGSTLGGHKIKSIGMPASWKSTHLSYGESYTEVIVPAEKPTVVKVAMVTDVASCSAPPRVLVPQAGKDYEAYLKMGGGKCSGELHALSSDEVARPDHNVRAGVCWNGEMKFPAEQGVE